MIAPILTKYPLILFFAVFLSLGVDAQIVRIDTITSKAKYNLPKYRTEQQYMYSVGIKAFSIQEFPKILNEVNTDTYTNTVMSGLFAKVNDNQISYRLAVNYYSKAVNFENECKDCQEANGKLKDFAAKVGFEKNFTYSTIQPYFAFDIGYRRSSFDGTISGSANYEANTLKNGFLISPNLGIKLNVASRITLVAETGMSLLRSYERQEKITRDASHTRTFNEYQKWEFLLEPLSMLSLQFNFGQAY